MKRHITHRNLRIESLELRELMSVTASEIPQPDFVTALNEYREGQDSEVAYIADSAQPVILAAVTPTKLAPPKVARPSYTATPTTLTVHWTEPRATSSMSVEGITHFKVTVVDPKKVTVFDGQAARSDSSIAITGLEPKTRYTVSITSCDETETVVAASTLRVTALTAAFPAVTARKSAVTLNTATLIITDRDRAVPFVDGKTVKTYTIEVTEKKTANWSAAQTIVIPAGTEVLDAVRGYVSADVDELKPNTDYLFRVTTAYTDASKPLSITGRNVTFRTAREPSITIAKTYFSVLDKTDYEFAVGMSARVANAKLLGDTATKLTLIASTGSALDKQTKVLLDSVTVSEPVEAVWDSKGGFVLPPVSIESLAAALGRTNLLAVKSLSFQLLITFEFSDGNSAQMYSRASRLTLPTWY